MFNAEALAQWQDLAVSYAPNIVGAIVIFLLGLVVARTLAGVTRKLLRRSNVDETLTSFLGNLVRIVILAFFIIAALGRLGVDTTSFAAVIAAAGLAIGLALQGSLGNFASGAMLIAHRPFKIGDFVEVAGTSGVVENLTIFSTHLRSGDNKLIIVPNGSITADTIVNYSAKDTRRIDLVIGIGYGDDIRQAKEVLEGVVKADERVLEDPAPLVAVSELGDSSVNLVVRPWVKTGDYWPTLFALTENIKLALDEAGIELPFPQRDVHLHQVSVGEGAAN
ncbi:MAG: mechanosensitive ion channel domain-containing protein [Acidobacteriota bacterium]